MTQQNGTIFTIGHSTRSVEALIALLEAEGIVRLVDIRTIPRSRFNPQFNGDALAESLEVAGLGYAHRKSLGGLRHPLKDSPNGGWRNKSFRGYADYMQTSEFAAALAALVDEARAIPLAVMCAEAVPWRCHRSLVADALSVRGMPVVHIMGEGKTQPHKLTPFALVEDGHLTYPPAQKSFDGLGGDGSPGR
jgi:uncharacterized protein (DUF488 family)